MILRGPVVALVLLGLVPAALWPDRAGQVAALWLLGVVLLVLADVLLDTTPQQAAAEVAERAGAISLQTRQRLVGVVENMSWMDMPDGSRLDLFGSGGGQAVADSLAKSVGGNVPLLGQIPIDTRLREGGDAGVPLVLSQPESAAGAALRAVAETLSVRSRGLAGMSLNISPAGR